MINNENRIDLNTLTKEELIELKKNLSNTSRDDIVLTALINNQLRKIEGKELNTRFDFNTFNVIPQYEKEILDYNGISNLQQLIDVDLNTLTDKDNCFIGMHMKDYFQWARTVYDLTSTVEINKKKENKKLIIKK